MSQPEEDFASMFEASLKAKRIEKGQTVEGTVVAIGQKDAFVSVGGKGEAMIDVAELKDADGVLDVAVGDRISAMVVSTEGGITLSRRLARGSATDRQLEDAYQAGIPVEGKVEQVNKGGYEIRIGKTRAFCPLSQIDIVRTADPTQHIGRVYTFRIVEFKEGGRNLVVSRRALLEQERETAAVEARRTVVPGAIVTGTVASVRDFGAFVELGGVQGLIHVSEMAWSRVTDPSALLKPGDTVTVKVLRVDEATGKIALGLKQLSDDPWANVASHYEVGQVRTARIVRISDFGAFVELEPGVEGLAHASTFAPTGRPGGWAKTISVGQTAAFEILNIDADKKRIGVAMVPEGSTRASEAARANVALAPGTIITGKVDRHEPFGVFVFLGPGKSALMPLSETGLDREGDVARAFPAGSDIEVAVLEADASGRRIRVSRKAVIREKEAAEVREYHEREGGSSQAGFGSLADKLRGVIKPK